MCCEVGVIVIGVQLGQTDFHMNEGKYIFSLEKAIFSSFIVPPFLCWGPIKVKFYFQWPVVSLLETGVSLKDQFLQQFCPDFLTLVTLVMLAPGGTNNNGWQTEFCWTGADHSFELETSLREVKFHIHREGLY